MSPYTHRPIHRPTQRPNHPSSHRPTHLFIHPLNHSLTHSPPPLHPLTLACLSASAHSLTHPPTDLGLSLCLRMRFQCLQTSRFRLFPLLHGLTQLLCFCRLWSVRVCVRACGNEYTVSSDTQRKERIYGTFKNITNRNSGLTSTRTAWIYPANACNTFTEP